MNIGLLHVVLFLVIGSPGSAPISQTFPMENVEECLTEAAELTRDAAAHMEQRETASKIVQVACILLREDQPA